MESQSSKKQKAQRHLVLFTPTPSLLSPLLYLSLPHPHLLLSSQICPKTPPPQPTHPTLRQVSLLPSLNFTSSSLPPPPSTHPLLPPSPPPPPSFQTRLLQIQVILLPCPRDQLYLYPSPSGEEILLFSPFLDVGAELIMTFLSLFLFLLPFSFPSIPSTAILCVLQSQTQTSNFEDTAGISHSRCWEGFPSRRERESRLRW